MKKLEPQYKIFYSWQSDNQPARDMIDKALKDIVKDFGKQGVSIERIEGGGGMGFIGIEEAVRMKIQSCDIFIGDITPVGNVALKEKLLPNANVMFEMGIATECLSAEQIIAVAAKGEWKFENMPFDFNHNSYYQLDPDKIESVNYLFHLIKSRLISAKARSEHINQLYFADWLVQKNIATGKYLPDTFLEDRELKDKVKCFVHPSKMYQIVFDRLSSMSFAMYDKRNARKGKIKPFSLRLNDYDLSNKAFDLNSLHRKVEGLYNNLSERINFLDKDGNNGWRTAQKVKHQADRVVLMNRKFLVIKSDAGQGKTNFLCDIVRNVMKPEHVPYVFVNAYELSAERIAQSIALEHNYIGNGSLEDVFQRIENFCKQHRQYLILVIDGLNEHPVPKLFMRNLSRVLQAVCGYEHVKVLMSCRKVFFDNNFVFIQKIIGNDFVQLDIRMSHGRNDLSPSEQECILERYMNHFHIQGILDRNIQEKLVSNLLFMRLFFEVHKNEDITQLHFVNRDEVYSRYFELMNNEAQRILEILPNAESCEGVPKTIVISIIEWMLENNVFKNIPVKELLNKMAEERKYFTSFINSNLLIQYDNYEKDNSTEGVINFTIEDFRDYLIVKYLTDNILPNDINTFKDYITKCTDKANNLAESVRHYLFLIARNTKNAAVIDCIKDYDWYDNTRLNGIWEVRNDCLTDEDVDFILSKIYEHPKFIIRALSISRWDPAIFSKLNITDLFVVLDSMNASERVELLSKVWSRKDSTYRPSECADFVKMASRFIIRGYQNGHNNLELLEHFLDYFTNKDGKTLDCVTLAKNKIKEAKEKGVVKHVNVPKPFVPECYQYEVFSYLMPVKEISREDFLAAAGAMEGYAVEMFGELYDAIFTESKDVESLYNQYYRNEYCDITQFISMHYCVPMPTADALTEVLKTSGNHIIDFNSIDYGNDAVDQFVMSDEMFDRFYNLIKYN